MINSEVTHILSRTVSVISQLIVQILDTAFFSHPWGGLGPTYDVNLGLIGKRVTASGLPIRVVFVGGEARELPRHWI